MYLYSHTKNKIKKGIMRIIYYKPSSSKGAKLLPAFLKFNNFLFNTLHNYLFK